MCGWVSLRSLISCRLLFSVLHGHTYLVSSRKANFRLQPVLRVLDFFAISPGRRHEKENATKGWRRLCSFGLGGRTATSTPTRRKVGRTNGRTEAPFSPQLSRKPRTRHIKQKGGQAGRRSWRCLTPSQQAHAPCSDRKSKLALLNRRSAETRTVTPPKC